MTSKYATAFQNALISFTNQKERLGYYHLPAARFILDALLVTEKAGFNGAFSHLEEILTRAEEEDNFFINKQYIEQFLSRYYSGSYSFAAYFTDELEHSFSAERWNRFRPGKERLVMCSNGIFFKQDDMSPEKVFTQGFQLPKKTRNSLWDTEKKVAAITLTKSFSTVFHTATTTKDKIWIYIIDVPRAVGVDGIQAATSPRRGVGGGVAECSTVRVMQPISEACIIGCVEYSEGQCAVMVNSAYDGTESLAELATQLQLPTDHSERVNYFRLPKR